MGTNMFPLFLGCFGVRVSVTFHLTCVHIILVRFLLLPYKEPGSSRNVVGSARLQHGN